MALHEINARWDIQKTYATEENLRRAIDKEKEKYPEFYDRFFVVRTPCGRWSAIVVLDKSVGGYVGRYPFIKV